MSIQTKFTLYFSEFYTNLCELCKFKQFMGFKTIWE
jgi:hypothetical protein